MPTESISVYFEPLNAIAGVQFHHETLVYTDSRGQRFVASAYASNPNAAGTASALSQASQAAAGNGQSAWGTLITQVVPFDSLLPEDRVNWLGTATNPRQSITLLQGADLRQQWGAITQAYSEIGSRNYAYSPATWNSNSVASTGLAAANIAPPDASIFSGHWAPAAGSIMPTSLTRQYDGTDVSFATDPPGDTTITVIDRSSSGDSIRASYDPNGALIGSVRTYTDGDTWFASHQLDPVRLANFDESAVSAFTQTVERDAFHGDATPSAAPWVLSYEPQFGSGYDFSPGNFDIDATPFSPAAPDLNVEGVSFGYDYSWLNNWNYGWEVSSFDGWDMGDSWDPVVLDLDGSGIDITNRTDSTVYFDVDGDGYKEQTAWAGANDGMLVIDLAGNGGFGADGQITQANEIAFSRWTSDPNDTDLQALRSVFDTNGDGQLTAADANWSSFRLWRDANQNGTVESGELQNLAQAGITQIGLTSDRRSYFLPDGSEINGLASFTMNGVAHTLADAGLAYDTAGFQRVPTSQGFNYVAEDGTTRQFVDTRVYVPPGWTTPAYNAVSSTVYLNIGTPDATHQYVDGYLAGQGDGSVGAYGSKPVTIYGDLGNDDLEGGDGNDVIDGGPGADYLLGFGGDDTIYFDSADVIPDDDPHAPAPTRFAIDGGTGYDTAIYTSTSGVNVNLAYLNMEAFIGNNGNDVVSAVGIQTGTQANPGAPAGAYIDGRAGDDQTIGSAQTDILVGGLGNDTIHGGDGADLITGDSGNDVLFGEAGDDNIMAGDGNDWISPGAGSNRIDGGTGNDTVDYSGFLSSQVTIAANADASVAVRRPDGTDTISNAEWLQFADRRRWIGITAGMHDFNGDRVADILLRNAVTGEDALVYMNATSGTTTWRPLDSVSLAWSIQGVGDFDHDGRSDILWRGPAGETGVWYMNQTAGTYSWGDFGAVSLDWTIQRTGDFNGDGTSDIFWRNSNGDSGIWYTNGTRGAYSWQYTGGVSFDWSVQATGDFNGDGRDDILWRNNVNGDTGVWSMNNVPGSYTWQDFGLVSGDWRIQPSGDFDGDRRTDILWRNNSNGDTGIWYMNSTPGSYSWQDLGAISNDWTIVQASDFSGDGRADILWRNTTSNDIGMWNSNLGVGGGTWQDLQTVGSAWRVN